MKIALIVVGVLLLMLLIMGAKVVGVSNDLATQQEAVKAASGRSGIACCSAAPT